MTAMKKPGRMPAAAMGLVLLLAACAPMIRPEQVVSRAPLHPGGVSNSPLRAAVAIASIGGGEEKADSAEVTLVDNKGLGEAVRLSLRTNGFLSSEGTAAPYRLKVFLIDMRLPPAIGLDFSADAFIRYTLIRASDGKVLFDDILSGSFTATFAKTFFGFERYRLAIEGAVGKSIAAFIAQLYRLRVAGTPVHPVLAVPFGDRRIA